MELVGKGYIKDMESFVKQTEKDLRAIIKELSDLDDRTKAEQNILKRATHALSRLVEMKGED